MEKSRINYADDERFPENFQNDQDDLDTLRTRWIFQKALNVRFWILKRDSYVIKNIQNWESCLWNGENEKSFETRKDHICEKYESANKLDQSTFDEYFCGSFEEYKVI